MLRLGIKLQDATRWQERLWRLAAQLARPLGALQWVGLHSNGSFWSERTPLAATGHVFMDDGDSVQVASLMSSLLALRASAVAPRLDLRVWCLLCRALDCTRPHCHRRDMFRASSL